MEVEPVVEDQLLTCLDWTDDEVSALCEAIMSDGNGKSLTIPAGVNKHFNMIILLRKFQNSTRKKVESKVLWDRLHSYYDISKLDSIMPCPFPNETIEFSLPDNDFSQLMRDRKSQSTSQDKSGDEDSGDSGSGRETPPTLPIAKRAVTAPSSVGSASSTSKRKYSASSTDLGLESGGSGRKSLSNTPATGGPTKAKRRI